MAAEYTDNLNQTFDVAAIKKQGDEAIAEVRRYLQECTDASKKMEQLNFSFLGKNTLKEMTANVQEADTITKKQDENIKKLNESYKEAVQFAKGAARAEEINLQMRKQAAAEIAKINKELADGERQRAKETQAANKTIVQSEKEKNKLIAESIKDYEKQLKEKARAEQEALKASQIRMKQEAEGAARADVMVSALTKEKERLEKASAREEANARKASSAYELLKKEYNDASKAAKELIIVNGMQDATTVKQVAHVQQLHAKLSQAEQAVGQYQRQVGNYNVVGAQFNQLLRELPNLAQSPQIFIMSLSNNISYFAEAVKAARSSGQSWGQILSGLVKNGGGFLIFVNLAITAVSYFTNKLAENKREADGDKKSIDGLAESIAGLIKKQSEYNRLRGDRAGIGTKGLERELSLMKAQGASSDAILKKEKEVNKSRLNDIDVEKSAYQALMWQIRNTYNHDADGEKGAKPEEAEKLKRTRLANDRDIINSIMQVTGVSREEAVKQAADIAETYNTAKSIIPGFVNEMNRLAQSEADEKNNIKVKSAEFETQLRDKNKKESEKAAKESAEREERRTKALVELGKVGLEDDINKQEAVLSNEEKTLQERLEANSRWLNDKLSLNDIEKQQELATKGLLEEEKLKIKAEYLIKENNIIAEGLKKQNELYSGNADEEFKIQLDAINNITANNLSKETEALQALTDQLAAKTITYQQYQAGVHEIQSKYAQLGIDDTIDYLQYLLDAEKRTGDQRVELQEKIDDLRKKSADAANKATIQGAKDAAAAEKEIIQKRIANIQYIKQAADEIASQLNAISQKRTDKEVAGLQKESEENDKSKDRQIEALDRLGLSTEEHDARKADIEARAEQRQAEIAAREAETKKRQANQDKGLAIFKATLSLFAGIAQEVAKGGVLGIATGAAVAIYMASVIATLASTQVPQYAEGTPDGGHPGGRAWVGDGYERELVRLKTGKSFITPAVPTLINLPAGAQVTPFSHLLDGAGQALNSDIVGMPMSYAQAMQEDFAPHADRIISAINNKSEWHISASFGELVMVEQKKHTITRWGSLRNK